jgi:hypothetical protein
VNGTVADHDTGLQCEEKTGIFSSAALILSESAPGGCPDPHEVDNRYEWSNVSPDPNGNAYPDFLARLNGDFDPDAATGYFAYRYDWRLPKIAEMYTKIVGYRSSQQGTPRHVLQVPYH